MRPTRGVGVALLLAGVLHLLTRITGGGWLALATGALLALPVAALLLRPRLDAVQVELAPVHARVGEQVEVVLRVRNGGRRPTPALRLTDRARGLAPVVVAVPALRPGDEVTTPLHRAAIARGRTASSPVELVAAAPLGLLRVTREVEVPGPFVVAPRRVAAVELVGGGHGVGGSSVDAAGAGTEVLGLRMWRPGDGARAVSARASARHGRPVVLERERDTGAAVVVLCAGAGRGPSWEQAVERCCALAEDAVRRGRPPVLLATGTAPPPVAGLGAVLDWHAGLDAVRALDAATLERAIRAAGPAGALVLLAPGPVVADSVQAVRTACARAGVRLTEIGA